VLGWLRNHKLLTDLAMAGLALAVYLGVVDELGRATALAVGAGVIVLTNLLLGVALPRE
jgi:hypothetical protein